MSIIVNFYLTKIRSFRAAKILKNQELIFKTIIVNLDVNYCQFEMFILLGLNERHVAGNPNNITMH